MIKSVKEWMFSGIYKIVFLLGIFFLFQVMPASALDSTTQSDKSLIVSDEKLITIIDNENEDVFSKYNQDDSEAVCLNKKLLEPETELSFLNTDPIKKDLIGYVNVEKIIDSASPEIKIEEKADVVKNPDPESPKLESVAELKSVPKKAIVAPAKKPLRSGGSIGRPGAIAAKTDTLDGKRVCAHKDDHPQDSKRNKKGHIDAECCLDTDETPNSLCYYPQKIYAKIIQKYVNNKK